MKPNKNFQKSKKSNSFDGNEEMRAKKVNSPSKKEKNFKNAMFKEIDELEEIDLFGYKDDDLITEDNSEEEDS
jgi:hypothetical protein